MTKANTELMNVLTKVRKQGVEPASLFLSSLWTDLLADSSFTVNQQQTANEKSDDGDGFGQDDPEGGAAAAAAQQNVGLLGDLMGGGTYALLKFNRLRAASEFPAAPKRKGVKEDPEAHLKWAVDLPRKSLTVPMASAGMDKNTYNMTSIMAMQLVVDMTVPKGATSETKGRSNVAGARTLGQQLVYDPKTHDAAQQLITIGIGKPKLRDELYVQVLKQLTENPYPAARAAGWLLLALFLHAFPPSVELYVHIQCHLKSVLLPFEVSVGSVGGSRLGGRAKASPPSPCARPPDLFPPPPALYPPRSPPRPTTRRAKQRSTTSCSTATTTSRAGRARARSCAWPSCAFNWWISGRRVGCRQSSSRCSGRSQVCAWWARSTKKRT